MNENLSFPFEKLETPGLTAPPDQTQQLKFISSNYIPDFINEVEEDELLSEINTQAWNKSIKRYTQHYGCRYAYKARAISGQEHPGRLPAWTASVVAKLVAQGVFKDEPNQMLVNQYQPGCGIAPHTDSGCFGATVASLSLGSACMMQLKPPNDKQKDLHIILEPRSLLTLSGASRNDWKHGIATRRSDKVAGINYPRKTRISLTFRTASIQDAEMHG